jgi:hypothetical protein
MIELNYSFSDGILRLGRGDQRFALDAANSLFHPLVDRIDALKPRRIHIDCRLAGKTYLTLVRALLHTELTQCTLVLLRREVDAPWEDFLYPLSKAFGAHLVARDRRRWGKVSTYRFELARKLPEFKYALSINVVSDGKDLARLAATLENIYSHDLRQTVVRVVGPAALRTSATITAYPDCEVVADDAIYGADSRFPISRKKNLVLDQTDSERVVILHERIRLGKDWVHRLLKDVRHFDLYTCALTTAPGLRYLDKFAIRFFGFPTLRKHHYFLTWNEDNAQQMVDGGLFVIHRRALGAHRFDESLHWGEMEDVDLVLRLKLAGSLVGFDSANAAESTTGGHFSLASRMPLSALYKIWVRRLSIGYTLTRWAGIWRASRKA